MANVKVCATVIAFLVLAVFPSKDSCYNISNVLPAINSTTLYFGLIPKPNIYFLLMVILNGGSLKATLMMINAVQMT